MSSRRKADRLHAVLRVRRVQEQQAAGRLAIANRQLREDEDRLAARRADVSAPWSDRGVVELAWQAADRAVAVVAGSTQVVDARRTDWQGAAQRVKGLERLDERRQADAAVDERRRVALIADDLTTTRIARRSGGAR